MQTAKASPIVVNCESDSTQEQNLKGNGSNSGISCCSSHL